MTLSGGSLNMLLITTELDTPSGLLALTHCTPHDVHCTLTALTSITTNTLPLFLPHTSTFTYEKLEIKLL